MRSKALLFTSVVLCASNVPANALSWNTQMNCASDYYAYCSKHTAGSAGCHACMRANRSKLSNACVSALIDDGVLSKANPQSPKTKIAAGKSRTKTASRISAQPLPEKPLSEKPVPEKPVTEQPAAEQAAKAPPAKAEPVSQTPEAAETPGPNETPGANEMPGPAETSASTDGQPPALPEPVANTPEPPALPPPQLADTAPAIDQQTFEALKNRAPYFVPTEDIASMFALADENAPRQQPSPPR